MGGLSIEPIPTTPHVAKTDGSQSGDGILSTSNGVVERPDHHCGDDLATTYNK